MSVEQTVREGEWNNTIFFLVEMTKKSKRPKSFFNENICRQRVMLDKKHIQSNWIYLQPSFRSSRGDFFENPSFLFKAVNSILN